MEGLSHDRRGAILQVVLFSFFLLSAHAADIRVTGDGVNPNQFRVTQFATGLNFPYSMQLLDDGSIIVATSRPTGTQPSLYSSVGEIVRLVDANQDGIADGPGTVLYTGLTGPLTCLRRVGQLLFVMQNTSGNVQIVVLRPGGTPASPYTYVGNIGLNYFGWEHTTYTLAVRPAPGNVPDTYDVFFNIGAQGNYGSSVGTIPLSGLLTGSINGDSIYAFTVGNTASATPVFSNLRQIAKGLRNAAGIVVHPATGDLYFEDNGIDGLRLPDEPLSVDKLNRIAASNIGASVPDFGFGGDYINYRTDLPVTGTSVPPLVTFEPIPDPFTGIPSESEGPVEIAVAPPGFPAGLNNGIFTGFHGGSHLHGVPSEENPVVYYDIGTSKRFDFIDNDQALGHPDTFLSTQNSLFVADMSSTGDLSTPGTGVIYQIQALATPTAAPPAPTPVSINPNTGSGAAATFQLTYTHPTGFAEINGVKVLFSASNPANRAANACLVYYDRSANAAYMTDDPGWNWNGPITLGTAATIENGQCLLDAGASSVSGSGPNLVLNLALALKPALQGARSIYTWAIDNEGVSSTWTNLGSWTVPGPATNPAPTADSATPPSGTGVTQNFTGIYSDANGYGELSSVSLLINSTPSVINACQVTYSRVTNQLFLTNDAGTANLGPIYPGASTLENTQCLLNGGESLVTAASGSENSLNLSVVLTLKSTLTGANTVYGSATDMNGVTTGWKPLSSWTVPANPLSLTVVNGSGQSATVNSAFAQPLQVLLADSSGTPIVGSAVVFSALATGASGVFAGGLGTVTVRSNGAGVATAPVLTANGTPGNFAVSAAAGAATASFPLTNLAGPPQLAITKMHTGSFTQGQTGATYTIMVSNAVNAGPTAGLVTVTENPPVGLTPTGLSGSGWSCVSLTCTRSDPLAGGLNYPPVAVIVNVASNAPAHVTNQATISGGGSALATANDMTAINANPPVLSISKTHTGTFTQGQSGVTYTITVSNAANAGPTSGLATVSDTLPGGLILVGMSGPGWACVYLTCTRSDPLAGGSTYPAITVSVNMALIARPVITNQATVSGGGSASATASDPANVSSSGLPFGIIDTPSDPATGITGALPVTGWALNNVGIASVTFWRDRVGSEPVAANGLVFVETAIIVPGTRPDVASAYPGYPGNNSGWGGQLLTNTLPGGGNGTYRLHVIATDVAGHAVEIGTRTITVNNAAAVLPFGAIDTPAPGATISGSAYVNFGWALTPRAANVIPKDGSTIWVYIDGQAAGHPIYNNNRPDIATLFPGLQNSNGAVGYFAIDSTKLANGIHQISWSVTDSAGNAQGIGSRFFFVQN